VIWIFDTFKQEKKLIKIEKNVPIEKKKGKEMRGRKATYPFNEMEVGDSFITPKKAIYSSVTSRHMRKPTERFTVSLQENGWYRIWRIK
jgi:hypothetical protein